MKAIQEQIARATAHLPEGAMLEAAAATELARSEGDEPLKLGLEAKRPKLGAGAGVLALGGAKVRRCKLDPSLKPQLESAWFQSLIVKRITVLST